MEALLKDLDLRFGMGYGLLSTEWLLDELGVWIWV
jgi:hypothetical protein